ncbi:MAG: recombinase family protein [Dehalococcoidia bacterium]|nr:recombinase family protein [Dehalococcoidia bacterium]
MRAVAYLRVSSVSQIEGYSLDAQERLFRELCKNRGWELVRVYREEGRSAHVDAIAKRPVFKQLLDDSAKNLFDAVVVHTLDRWSRNLMITMKSLAILAKYSVGLVSITEPIDYSTPIGKFCLQMIGSIAELSSDNLGAHVSKVMYDRTAVGRHTGGIPFGYESCWIRAEMDQRIRRCDPECPGGLHRNPAEANAVVELFNRYATGTATLSQLAAWLNDHGFRTRNTKKLPDANGNLAAGPRLFTTASVRGILHNPFYAGKVKYKDNLMSGAHIPLISQEVFDLVQDTLKKNSGRSETLHPRPEREYLLKGIIRCAYCGMPISTPQLHQIFAL